MATLVAATAARNDYKQECMTSAFFHPSFPFTRIMHNHTSARKCLFDQPRRAAAGGRAQAAAIFLTLYIFL